MINRVLIRMKVVQMLYSYLLTRNQFKIQPAPANPTKDQSFAYSVYIDSLLLMLELSGYRVTPDQVKLSIPVNPRLNQSGIIRALAANDDIRAVINRGNSSVGNFSAGLSDIYNAVISSDLYKKYLRARNRGIKEDVQFWTVMFKTVIEKSAAFQEGARKSDEFTLNGLELGIEMLIATLEEFDGEHSGFAEARNALDRSLDKAYQLYHALLTLPVEIVRCYDLQLDNARNKYLPTSQDLNPDTRLLDSPLVKLLADNVSIREYADEHPGEWTDDSDLLSHLLKRILESEEYKNYMALPSVSLSEDADFWRQVMKSIILPDDDLAEVLESKSVYWNDDLDIMGTFALKTLRKFATSPGKDPVLPQYKDDEDARFGADLFVNVVDKYDEYRNLVDHYVDNQAWDSERLAFMDVIIMATAIAEMLNYPQIPIPVTLNEYIEIANSYSTPRSGKFINGVLYSIINHLKEEGKLMRDN